MVAPMGSMILRVGRVQGTGYRVSCEDGKCGQFCCTCTVNLRTSI